MEFYVARVESLRVDLDVDVVVDVFGEFGEFGVFVFVSDGVCEVEE